MEAFVDADGGVKANFISADDLLASKLASGRPQDMADAEAIRDATKSRRTNDTTKSRIKRGKGD